MRILNYVVEESAASLWRGRRSAALSVGTITAALVLLGGFLLVTSNLDRLVAQWSTAAEFSVYLEDLATLPEQQAIGRTLNAAAVVASYETVTKDLALDRFKADFPDLAGAADSVAGNPLPASVEVRLEADAQPGAVAQLADRLLGMPGVVDVRYDQQWIERIQQLVAVVRGVGLSLALVPVLAAALTVSSVVRLALFARLDEVRTMLLVGAPLGYVRGPFVMEGIMQGGLGAVLAVGLLYGGYVVAGMQYGEAVAFLTGPDGLRFLPWEMIGLVVVGGMLVGCLGGFIAARGAHRALAGA